jgi:uncharacterized membrane protein YjjP (DUF1212 family)
MERDTETVMLHHKIDELKSNNGLPNDNEDNQQTSPTDEEPIISTKEHENRERSEKLNYHLLLDTALLAGEIMVKGGAETYRVEDTMTRILGISGFERAETLVMVTGIFVTLDDPSIEEITQVRRVTDKYANLNHVYEVNAVSRKLCSGQISIEQAYQELNCIKERKQYPIFMVNICILISTAFFTLLLGANWIAAVLAALNGTCIVVCRAISERIKLNNFITDMLASFLIAICTMLYESVLGNKVDVEIIIVGSIIPLVPGVAITNAIRDTLQGDYLSGGSRAIEAFVIASSIAVGIGIGLAIFPLLVGGATL